MNAGDFNHARPVSLPWRLALVFLVFLSTRVGLARTPSPVPSGLETGLPSLRTFTPKEYGASAENWSIVQDHRGVIYVANREGVLEFDGVRWRLIRVAKGARVRSLAVDEAGRVYVGAFGELGTLEPDAAGQMQFVSWVDRLPPGERDFGAVERTFATREGVVFTTFTRIFRVGPRVEVWKPRTLFRWAFQVGNRLFVREVDRGLLEFVEGNWRLIPGGERFAKEGVYVMLPGADSGTVVIGTRTLGFQLFDGVSLRPFITEADAAMQRDLLYYGLKLANGNLALGTSLGGLYLLDPRGHLLARVTKPDGLLDSGVYALAQDRQGGVWMGLAKGLARAEVGFPLTAYTGRNGVDSSVIALHRHQGTFYAGTTLGLSRLVTQPQTGNRFVPLPEIKSETWAFLDAGPGLLVANDSGVYEVRKDTAKLVRSSTSRALCRSRKDPARVFVGLEDGLASLRWAGERWVDEGKVLGVTDEIRTLLEGADGRLWLGTRSKGVLRLTFAPAASPLVERFGMAEGLPNPSDNRVYDLNGELLLATHRGLYRFDDAGHRFAPDPRFARLFPQDRWVMGLRPGAGGRIWMHAVDEARNLRETGAAQPQGDGTYRWLPTPPLPLTVTDNDLCTWADPDGVVWFGSPDGIFRYDPAVPKDYQQTFRALVRGVTRGPRTIFGGAGTEPPLTLKYADKALRFEFAAPSFDSLEANRFQVLLDGEDPDWKPWSAETYQDYTNLREGRYKFRVRARNLYGTLSDEGVYSFRVLPPPFRTWWAYLLYVLAGSGIIFLIFRERIRHLRRRNEELQHLVQEATVELSAREQETKAQAEHLARAYEELQGLNAQLQELSEQKNVFFGIVAHDLRNPLSGIVLLAQLLDGEEDLDYIWASARKIQREGMEMSNLIGRFLEIGAIESGDVHSEPSAFEILAIAQHVADRHGAQAEAKGIELRVVPAAGSGEVWADLKFTKEVLDNLISNAIKFSPPGKRVQISAERIGEKIVVSVSDQGPGLTPEDRLKLFGRFARLSAKPTGGEKSTGLGLSIVKHMVEAMGGRIWVDSEPGQGATFRVELPTKSDQPTP